MRLLAFSSRAAVRRSVTRAVPALLTGTPIQHVSVFLETARS